jgi:hypothetical protein
MLNRAAILQLPRQAQRLFVARTRLLPSLRPAASSLDQLRTQPRRMLGQRLLWYTARRHHRPREAALL